MQNKLDIGDVLIMKKNHACGENRWQVIRLGVDIKLKCLKCGHEILMDRVELYKKMRKKEKKVGE